LKNIKILKIFYAYNMNLLIAVVHCFINLFVTWLELFVMCVQHYVWRKRICRTGGKPREISWNRSVRRSLCEFVVIGITACFIFYVHTIFRPIRIILIYFIGLNEIASNANVSQQFSGKSNKIITIYTLSRCRYTVPIIYTYGGRTARSCR